MKGGWSAPIPRLYRRAARVTGISSFGLSRAKGHRLRHEKARLACPATFLGIALFIRQLFEFFPLSL